MFTTLKKSLILLTLFNLISLGAIAQIHQGHYLIIQNGKNVGEIFVPTRGLTEIRYSEIWIVGSNYVYPSESNKGGFEIKVSGKSFKNEKEFLAAARAIGGKVIRVNAEESPNQ